MGTDALTDVREMRSQTAAFDDAHESLGRLGIPDVLPALHAAGLSISRTVLGGSHSVAVYPPIDSLIPVDANHVLDTIRFGRDTSLYLHIPFCETRCTFCHYAVQHYPGRGRVSQTSEDGVTHHLEALKRELAFWGARLAQSGTVLSSIYIGGGTPLVLEEDALHDIIRAINEGYEVLPGAEVCIEGSPLTITAADGEDKLCFLKEQGFTRLSFGVQSFDDAVLKYAARGYKRDIPIRAAQIVSRIFDNWNIDLIQGLYKGSPTETWQNLEVLAEVRPPHLTWYHGRFADRPQGAWYKSEDRRGSFEDETATLLGRMLIWQGMAALGYQQIDGNRFVRERHFTDPFKKVRTSSSHGLLGVGAASYSHISADPPRDDCHGYVFRNETRIRAYADGVLSGYAPMATGRVIDDEELLATSYATGLRNGRIENAALRAIGERKLQLSAHYGALAGRLSDIGILEPYANGKGEDGVRLTKLGRLFEDETLALFFSPSVKRALTTPPTNLLALTIADPVVFAGRRAEASQ
ncbi:MAG: radical SAM protein [Actinomycetota bacterium]|nr:radical SAM protein [Actinomycetota bacterium]MDQ3956386.1 radical SAM protein [Actinomycetota bacterium]